ALRLRPDDFSLADLCIALADKGQWDKVIAESRAVAESKDARRTGRDISAATRTLRWAEGMAALDQRLPDVLEGKDQPRCALGRLPFAQLCRKPYRRQYAAAARFYAEAFAEALHLAENLSDRLRYQAARAAALAGCGQGRDASGLDEKERA